MAKQFPAIDAKHREFIEAQQMFFVATAAESGRVNLSPKGKDAFRVLGANRILWLNLTGSGNETAAHLKQNPRMTVMFCAFEGAPMILRLYGTARTVHEWDADWATLYGHFDPATGARQVYDMAVDLVQTSCGFAVPAYTYEDQRDILDTWAEKRGKDGVRTYWRERNGRSIDGFETGTARET
ncbi:MAG: pyridoxamine 5'-phosphate oxidase family protein [Pseudomonadota bacterium]